MPSNVNITNVRTQSDCQLYSSIYTLNIIYCTYTACNDLPSIGKSLKTLASLVFSICSMFSCE